MKKLIVVFCIIGTLSCNEKTIEKPEDLIPKDQMIEIIYDLAIINAAKKTNSIYLVDNNIEAMPFIYKRYGIDSLQFVKSDIYYASIPSEYEAMYKIVEARIEREKGVYDNTKTKASDSVRKIAEEQRQRLREQAKKKKQEDTVP